MIRLGGRVIYVGLVVLFAVLLIMVCGWIAQKIERWADRRDATGPTLMLLLTAMFSGICVAVGTLLILVGVALS